MDGATFITAFREETMDESAPPLWTDSLILRYLDEAQIKFCQHTEGIEDSTSAVCTVELIADESLTQLHPSILKVRAASIGGSRHPLEVVSVEEARRDGMPLASTARGTPRAIVQGLGSNRVQLYPVPTEDVTLNLDVFRLPLKRIDTHTSKLEVPDKHVPTIMHYVLYRAYSRPDPDTMDRARADYFHERFLQDCAAAKREQGRARKPNGATQFSW